MLFCHRAFHLCCWNSGLWSGIYLRCLSGTYISFFLHLFLFCHNAIVLFTFFWFQYMLQNCKYFQVFDWDKYSLKFSLKIHKSRIVLNIQKQISINKKEVKQCNYIACGHLDNNLYKELMRLYLWACLHEVCLILFISVAVN